MHHSYQKILALLLAGLMLLSVVACGRADAGEKDTLPPKDRETLAEGETKDPNFTCDLPDNLNFGGTEVNIMHTEIAGREDEMPSERLGRGTISDAVYERNLAVENQLGVKLSLVSRNNDMDVDYTLQTMVRAGDSSVDIFTYASHAAIPTAISGHYLDLNRVQNMDTSKHYWIQDYNNIVTFTDQNMQFLATSSAALSMFRLTYFTIFNTELFKERKLTSLYQIVENGEWTLDYQYGLVADSYVDGDGDGMFSEKDFYGYITSRFQTQDAHLMASGIRVAIRDENGNWIFNSEKLDAITEMVEKVCALNTSPGTYMEPNDGIGVYHVIDKFARKEGLMATTIFLSLERRIEALTEITYGIVPMPKLIREQPNYYSFVQDQVSSFGISAAVGNESRQAVVGAVMESIAYHSNEIVRPAYYDTALSLRFMQDPQSRNMLDIMFETLSFDLGYYIGLGQVREDMRSILHNSNPAVASKFKAWERHAKNMLKKYEESLDQILKN